MKPHPLRAAILAAAPAVVLATNLLYSTDSSAATLYYNTAVTGTGAADDWDGSTNWSTTAGGPYNTGWTDGSDAVFMANQTTVVDNNFAPNSIQQNNTVATSLTLTNPSGSSSGAVYTLTTSTLEAVTSSTFAIGNVTLGGNSLLVGNEAGDTGARVVLTFQANNPNVTPYNGTITFNTAGGTFNLSNGTAALTGPNTNVYAEDAGTYIVPEYSVTMGTLSSANSTGAYQIFTNSATNPVLTINESSSTTAYALFNAGSHPMSVDFTGGNTLILASAKALQSPLTTFTIENTGQVEMANTSTYGNATGATSNTTTYVSLTISNGGFLSNSATGQYMIGATQSYTAATGLFANTSGTVANTNGYSITTSGSTAYIKPTGIFGLTSLNASTGAALGISAGNDELALYTLIADASADGDFVIDCSGFTSPIVGTPYTVLEWNNETGVALGDFSAIDPSGYSAAFTLNSNNLQITFSAVPEPATAALLLGGLPLLLRRRRGRNPLGELE